MFKDIPCTLMRGGTSKGPYFQAHDLPSDPAERDRILLAAMGSPHIRQVDGIGGGDTLSSKAVIVSPSTQTGIDIEYLFAQVSVDQSSVDTMPNCGNMLAGVGPFAIENGLVKAQHPVTTLRILNRNTGKIVESIVQTPDGKVTYDGGTRIDGVPGTGAPIVLNFLDAAGAKTGKLFPTGQRIDRVGDIDVTCIDFASPLVFVAAESLGRTGHETRQELDADSDLKARLEAIRLEIALRAGMGDVRQSVLPKIALVASPAQGGTITSRYFTPWTCHSAFAVTGALCLAAASSIEATVPSRYARRSATDPDLIRIEHPAGGLDIRMGLDPRSTPEAPHFAVAGLVRTARPLFIGVVHVPLDKAKTAA
ncbi:4-oxalomesaconate tautomerase [Denitromonas ohlonensis]|uniref:4-oxalomesaconate tautomerase n=2 Tax=Denitromonas TaxID=139331 RepID=A0A557RNT0_9RHOO|nr:4-oxalomesaconate tautomerase [Denitromonas ohlonensis]TVO66821.1 4-oxalomesaconate tautomerase [Denitromonas ohlonensis]TVO79691.1 4-oxalomesaconate tautomerase [Denitromonas ohlonensis]